jgi:DNA polymerase-3 subunit epsilon
VFSNVKPVHQLALTIGCVAALFAGGAALVFFAVWAGLEGAPRAAFADAVVARIDLAIIAGALVVALAAGAIAALFRRHVLAPHRLAEETRLITHANPAHRLAVDGDGALAQLAAEINRLADRLAEVSAGVEARVVAARADLVEEKNRLAALMEELAQGVLVCNVEGRILLHNRRARVLLAPPDSAPGAGVGLGRSLFGLIGRDAPVRALEEVAARMQAGEVNPVASFDTTLADGSVVRVLLAPVAAAAAGPAGERADTAVAGDTRIAGYVLTFEHRSTASTPTPAAAPAHRPLALHASPSRPAFYDFDLFGKSVRSAALDDCPLGELSYTVFDTETTGLRPAEGDEIISIGAIRIVNGKLLHGEVFDQLIDPQRPLPAASVRIHGIEPAMLAGQPVIARVLPRFHAFCADTVLVAHNAAFDMRFLQLKEAATGLRFDQPVLDTLMLSAVAHPHQPNHTLEAIAARLGLNIVGRHTALGDAIVTGEIFLRLLPLLAAAGITTLRQARDAARRTAYARVEY